MVQKSGWGVWNSVYMMITTRPQPPSKTSELSTVPSSGLLNKWCTKKNVLQLTKLFFEDRKILGRIVLCSGNWRQFLLMILILILPLKLRGFAFWSPIIAWADTFWGMAWLIHKLDFFQLDTVVHWFMWFCSDPVNLHGGESICKSKQLFLKSTRFLPTGENGVGERGFRRWWWLGIAFNKYDKSSSCNTENRWNKIRFNLFQIIHPYNCHSLKCVAKHFLKACQIEIDSLVGTETSLQKLRVVIICLTK